LGKYSPTNQDYTHPFANAALIGTKQKNERCKDPLNQNKSMQKQFIKAKLPDPEGNVPSKAANVAYAQSHVFKANTDLHRSSMPVTRDAVEAAQTALVHSVRTRSNSQIGQLTGASTAQISAQIAHSHVQYRSQSSTRGPRRSKRGFLQSFLSSLGL
jgi:hypothetical protein